MGLLPEDIFVPSVEALSDEPCHLHVIDLCVDIVVDACSYA